MIKDLLADPKGLCLDTRITTLGHVQRGDEACAYDRMLSTLQGVEAVYAVLDATPETPTPFIAITENKITRKPLVQAVIDIKEVSKAIQARDFDRAIGLRDTEFSGFYRFYITTAIDLDESMKLSSHKHMRIAIIHVGAPAGGMNAATRAAFAYCLTRGHKPIAIHNGFAGFARHHDGKPLGTVRDFGWLKMDGWASKGSSEIGTNRELPSEAGIETFAELFKLYSIQGFLIVGGFERFHALSELRQGREKYGIQRRLRHLP